MKPREALEVVLRKFPIAVDWVGTECDPEVDGFLYDTIKVLEAVRRGASEAELDRLVSKLLRSYRVLHECAIWHPPI